MTDEKSDNEIRNQADADDARLEARMKAIMEHRTPRPAKARAVAAPSGNPDWMKSKPKAKPQPAAAADKPARATKRKTPVVKPPRNSEESWKMAADFVARKQAEE